MLKSLILFLLLLPILGCNGYADDALLVVNGVQLVLPPEALRSVLPMLPATAQSAIDDAARRRTLADEVVVMRQLFRTLTTAYSNLTRKQRQDLLQALRGLVTTYGTGQ